MKRLKTTEIKAYREQEYQKQNGICALCKQPMTPEQSVADHRHSDGKMRRILHRTCNSLLGKWENALKRFGIDELRAESISENIIKYVSDTEDVLHPTYKTPEEKKALTKKRRARGK